MKSANPKSLVDPCSLSADPTRNEAPMPLHVAGKSDSPEGEMQSSWSCLFHSGKGAQLHYHQPLFADGKSSVSFLNQCIIRGISMWKDCLVGQFLGASLSPKFKQLFVKFGGKKIRLMLLLWKMVSFCSNLKIFKLVLGSWMEDPGLLLRDLFN